jgi:ribosomal protein S18 acetylase RimI-like enzyme
MVSAVSQAAARDAAGVVRRRAHQHDGSDQGGIVSTATDGTARVRVMPIARAPWSDVDAVFGTRGDPARCWCQYFKGTAESWRTGDRQAFRDALHDQARAEGPGPGVIARRDGQAVGWCAVEPRSAYPALARSRLLRDHLATPEHEPSVWSVTCFVVPVRFRHQGVAQALLAGAVEHARRQGARTLEAYPVDAARKDRVSAAELYHGPLSLFLAAGFTEAARPSDSRAVVRLELER